MKSVFISYSRSDGTSVAEFFEKRLKGAGFDVFRDKHDLDLGQYEKQLMDNIASHDCFLVLLTNQAVQDVNRWIAKEIKHAQAHQRTIIPIRCWQNELPPLLTGEQAEKIQDENDRLTWIPVLDFVARQLENPACPVDRAVNLSMQKEFESFAVERLLILNETPARNIDQSDPIVVEEEAYRFAELTLPLIRRYDAGVIPPGLAGLAICFFTYVEGANKFPKVYWPFQKNKTGNWCVDGKVKSNLQHLRDHARSKLHG